MKRLINITAILLFCIVALSARRAGAGGFMIFEHSALATGMADARTALWDDPSALWFNPAAISELEGFHIALGDTLIIPFNGYDPLPVEERSHGTYPGTEPGTEIYRDGQNPAKGDFSLFYPFHVYFTARATKWLALGIGVNNPFGLGVYWPADWDGRFTAYRSDLRTFFIQPAASVNLARLFGLPRDALLSLAVGFNYVYGDATIEEKVDLSNFGAEEPGDMKLKGKGHGLGANYAFFAGWKPWFTVGASIRSNVHMTFSGEASFTNIEPILQQLLGLPESTSGSTSIELPWNMNFGLAFHGLKKFTFAVDLYVGLWQSYDTLKVKFDCSTDGSCSPDLNTNAVYPKNWHTSYEVSIGAEYRPIKAVAIRIGYGYETDPSDPEYYDAMLPDGNRHLACAGIGYRAPKYFKLDIGYMLATWKGTKNNEVGAHGPTGRYDWYANGTYRTISHLLAVTLGFSFGGPAKGQPMTMDQ